MQHESLTPHKSNCGTQATKEVRIKPGTVKTAESGSARYNELIYSDGATADQILGFGAELFWNFGEFGVLFGYVLLGLWARHLDERSRRSDDPLATYTYTYTYMGLWVALTIVNSLSIVSQGNW